MIVVPQDREGPCRSEDPGQPRRHAVRQLRPMGDKVAAEEQQVGIHGLEVGDSAVEERRRSGRASVEVRGKRDLKAPGRSDGPADPEAVLPPLQRGHQPQGGRGACRPVREGEQVLQPLHPAAPGGDPRPRHGLAARRDQGRKTE